MFVIFLIILIPNDKEMSRKLIELSNTHNMELQFKCILVPSDDKRDNIPVNFHR